MAVAQAPALQRGVQPVGGGLAHLGMDPELLGRHHRRVLQVGGQIDPWPRAVVLEAQPAAHIGAVVAALHAQPRGRHAQAVAVAEGDDAPGQLDLVDHAEAAGPVDADRAAGLQRQFAGLRIAVEAAAQPAHTGRAAGRRECQLGQPALAVQRTARHPAHRHLGQLQARLRHRQPAAQAGRKAVAEPGHRDQRRHVEMVAEQGETAPAGHGQPIQALQRLPGLAELQLRRIQPPAAVDLAPARRRTEGGEGQRRPGAAVGQRRAAQPQIAQRGLHGHPGDTVLLQVQPALDLADAALQFDPGGMQQAGPAGQLRRAHRQIGLAVAAVSVQLQHRGQRRLLQIAPALHADLQALAVHAHPQVDLRHLRFQAQRRGVHAQAAIDDLQFAQPLQRIQRIAALPRGRQALHAPVAVVGAQQGQRQPAQAQLGERAPGQQPRVHRHQHLGLADAHALAGADAQAVQAQQRTAPGPGGLQPVEADRPSGAFAQPRRHLLRMLLYERQRLAQCSHRQGHAHQPDRHRIERETASQAQAAAQGGMHQMRGMGNREWGIAKAAREPLIAV